MKQSVKSGQGKAMCIRGDKHRAVVCLISCVEQVQNIRTIRTLSTIAEYGYSATAIMPGTLPFYEEPCLISHYPLPAPQTSFWYDAGFFNTLRAIIYRLKNSFLLARRLARIRPDIVICREPDSWLIAVLAKLWFGCKVVADLREVYEDRSLAFPKFTQGLVRKLLRNLMKYLSRFTDEIIHVSPERRQAYSYLHKPGVVIGQYPELRLFPRRDRSQNVSGNLDPSLVTAIHVGALRPTYASEQLLDAMVLAAGTFPKIRFVVLGGIAGKLSNADLVEFLKNKGVLQLVQQIPFSEVLGWLYASDIGISLVLPVDKNCYLAAPQKLYEYFAAGLPVVAADVPTLRRVVTKYECGLLVDPFSPRDIASALIQLAQDDDLRQRMGQNARRAAEAEFNWEGEQIKLYSILEYLENLQ
jgi:glycosyltransferase involved in cell wall biosynthesis